MGYFVTGNRRLLFWKGFLSSADPTFGLLSGGAFGPVRGVFRF